MDRSLLARCLKHLWAKRLCRKFYINARMAFLWTKLSCQRHKLFISQNVVFWQLSFSDNVRGFDSVERCLCLENSIQYLPLKSVDFSNGGFNSEVQLYQHDSGFLLEKIERSFVATLAKFRRRFATMTAICWLTLGASEDFLFYEITRASLGFCAAGWLHLAMDIMTPSGIPLITPFGTRTSLNLYKTAQTGEWLCILLFVVGCQTSPKLVD